MDNNDFNNQFPNENESNKQDEINRGNYLNNNSNSEFDSNGRRYVQFDNNKNINSDINSQYQNNNNFNQDYTSNNYLNEYKPRKKGVFRSILKAILAILFAVIVFVFGFATGSSYDDGTKNITNSNDTKSKSPFDFGNTSIGGNWKKLDEIKKQLETYYLGELDQDKMVEGAIKGMVNSLGDPYTVYYNPEEFQKLMQDNAGKFVGVGIQVSPKDGYITVVSPIEGGPAKEAGIIAGDKISKINGTAYTDKQMEDAVSVMRGKEGEEVTLTILRDGKEKDYKIVRREIKMSSVSAEMIDANTALITLSQFNDGTAKEFETALNDMKSKGMKGLILDLRGNPGGYLNECVDIASNFIEKNKVVVYQIDKNERKVEEKSKGGNYIGLPMVVLIDGGSASASEVLTGAFKDYQTATIIGSKSYGKGIVQSILKVGNGAGLKVTVSSFFSPNGINIHKTGIVPEIVVEYPKELLEKPYDRTTDPQFKKALEVLKSKMLQ